MTAYLDHAATTPMLPAAVEALTEQATRVGNASSLHTSGRAARAVVEESRERIASVLGARPSEVVFTSGGTEADNLAVKGTYAARRRADPARTRLVVSAIEHHAVLDPVEFLVRQGASVSWLEPDRCGHVAVDDLRESLARGRRRRPGQRHVGQQRGRHGAARRRARRASPTSTACPSTPMPCRRSRTSRCASTSPGPT